MLQVIQCEEVDRWCKHASLSYARRSLHAAQHIWKDRRLAYLSLPRIRYFEYISNDILLSCTGRTHPSDILSQPCYVVFGHVFHLEDGVAADMAVAVKLIWSWFVFRIVIGDADPVNPATGGSIKSV